MGFLEPTYFLTFSVQTLHFASLPQTCAAFSVLSNKNRIESFHPTFRSKISYFIISPAINFQSNMNFLDFYAGGESNYMVYLKPKNDIIQFSLNPMKSQGYLHLFQKRYQEKYWFSKKYCRMWYV